MNINKTLFRSKKSKIAGVCQGLGEFTGVDPTILRLLFVIGLFTPFPVILTYLIMWIIIPKEKNITEEVI
jgi:phage shock protein PspC (stress-responsive transcriptional regulator)